METKKNVLNVISKQNKYYFATNLHRSKNFLNTDCKGFGT